MHSKGWMQHKLNTVSMLCKKRVGLVSILSKSIVPKLILYEVKTKAYFKEKRSKKERLSRLISSLFHPYTHSRLCPHFRYARKSWWYFNDKLYCEIQREEGVNPYFFSTRNKSQKVCLQKSAFLTTP